MTLTNNSFYHTFYATSSANPSVMTRNIYDNIGILQETLDISFGGINIVDVFNLMDGAGSNPYTLGLADSAQNKICMDLAYSNVYTKSLTTRQQSLVISYVNKTFKEPHTYANVIYTVTVSGGVYWLQTGGAAATERQSITLGAGLMYVFDQSHPSNFGNTLVLGQNQDTAPYYTTKVVINSKAGSANAYTLIDLSGQTLPSPALKYFSGNTAGLGSLPPSLTSLRIENFATIALGNTLGVGYGPTGYSTSAAGITFDGTGTGYVIYGSATALTTTDSVNYGKTPFTIFFDVTFATGGNSSQHVWANAPDRPGAPGMLLYLSSGSTYMLFYDPRYSQTYFSAPITFGTRYTYKIERTGNTLGVSYSTDRSVYTDSPCGAYPASKFSYDNTTKKITANTADDNIDLGWQPLRLGGFRFGSSGANYAAANSTEYFKGTLNNFIINK